VYTNCRSRSFRNANRENSRLGLTPFQSRHNG
jgi:hypothetical protein